MKLIDGACWGLVPARGGSRSVRMKNLAMLGGRPLLDYGAAAGAAATGISRMLCSTDAPAIAERCAALGVEVHHRPAALSGDDTAVFDVIAHLLADLAATEGEVAEWMALLQPTSPFVTPAQIEACLDVLRADGAAGSVQTVIPVPHNQHAFNQRTVADGEVSFRFAAERADAYNKQRKPPLFLFGNLVIFHTARALEQGAVFAAPSRPVEIPPLNGFDCDGPMDFAVGEALLAAGLVELSYLPAN